jgi:hypothetical protein
VAEQPWTERNSSGQMMTIATGNGLCLVGNLRSGKISAPQRTLKS